VIARDTAYDDGFQWVQLEAPEKDELMEIANRFHLHPIAVEDALHPHQRTKAALYGDSWFLVLKAARYLDSEEVVELDELMVFVAPTYFVTISHGAGDVVESSRQRLEQDQRRLVLGPYAALHDLLDLLIEQYGDVVDSVAVDIDQIQSEVFSGDRRNHAERIFKLKREVLEFRQAVVPITTQLDGLPSSAGSIPKPLHPYFDDVSIHARRLEDRIEGQDRLLSDALHANVAVIGTRQNEDMRKISAWVAIVSVPTMIAGIYGMNFEHMPELEQRWAYPAVLAFMAACCVGLYRMFRRRGWL
jgi:magnesium transporter